MRAERFILRFVAGVSLPAATYGSGTYGTQTYGQAATDPLPSFRIRPVPIPAGWPVDPAWLYRASDTGPPFVMQVLTDEGALDLVPVTTAALVLDNHDRLAPAQYVRLLTKTGVPGELTYDWGTGPSGGLPPEGIYRVAVVLVYTSTRRLSVPYDDRCRLVVNATTRGIAPPP